MYEEIKACPICGEPNRPAFPHCTKCRAGKYCEKCKRKHSILADFCDECITAAALPPEDVRLEAAEIVAECDPVQFSDVMPVVARKPKFTSVTLIVVCVLFITGVLFAINTTGRVAPASGVNKRLDDNTPELTQSGEKFVGKSGPQAGSIKENESEQLSEDSSRGPRLPYEDSGACPFEGCTYRCWTVNKDTEIKSGKEAKSSASFTVKKGEQVIGVTGTVITTRAGRARLLKNGDIAGVKAKAGQTIYLLTYLGEGYYKAWYGGKIIDGVDLKGLKLIEKPKYTWWVQIQEKNGQSGWSNQPENFDHKDSLE